MLLSTAVVLAITSGALALPLRSLPVQRRALPPTGNCDLPEIEFIESIDDQVVAEFNTADQDDFPHSPDSDFSVIADFVCSQLESHCDAPAATVALCQNATSMASKLTGGVAADVFNGVLQIATDFASLDNSSQNVSNVNSNQNVAQVNNNQNVANASNVRAVSANNDLGSCGSPEIQFANGLDGRKEPSFAPINEADFNHGSALNIGVITNFICGQLQSKCQASSATVDTCNQAAAAAAEQSGGAAADAFNAAFGIKSNFAAVKAARELTERAGANLQKFTGNLGASTPTVTALGNGQFQVDGNAAFNNLQNALVRSCDVQHNECSNAANASGNKGSLSVQACEAQQTQCNALASSQ
ncbi:hypothetical protein M422DRAFT_43341 [Sphaerobolus stellatus SS14]|nr:hypothetical protein M422DRAFT_43341 [Sphaerobolus stellatus SS14]